jgi:hypothetical protein
MRINRSVVWSGLFCGMLMLASAQIEPRGENPAIRVNTLYGATGLITVPTTTTTRVERFQLGTAFGHDVHTVSLNWGVYEGIEIGGTVVDVVGAENRVIATGKVTILPQNFEWLELGFGAIDPFDAIQKSFYGIASANVRVPTEEGEKAIRLRLHLGYGTGAFREKLIGGAELFLDKPFSVIAEYNGVDTNAALRYVHDESLRLQLGIQAKVLYFSATYGLSF